MSTLSVSDVCIYDIYIVDRGDLEDYSYTLSYCFNNIISITV